MELSSITPQARDIDILHPATNEATGLVIKMLPLSSDEVQAVKRKALNAKLQMRTIKLTAEQLEAQTVDLLCAAVCGWEWNGEAMFEGGKPEFSIGALRKLIKVRWIREQLDRELGDESAFFTA